MDEYGPKALEDKTSMSDASTLDSATWRSSRNIIALSPKNNAAQSDDLHGMRNHTPVPEMVLVSHLLQQSLSITHPPFLGRRGHNSYLHGQKVRVNRSRKWVRNEILGSYLCRALYLASSNPRAGFVFVGFIFVPGIAHLWGRLPRKSPCFRNFDF